MADKLHILQLCHMFMSQPDRFGSSMADPFSSDDMLFMAQQMSKIIKKLLHDSRRMHNTIGEVSEIIERIVNPEKIFTINGRYPLLGIPLGFRTVDPQYQTGDMGGVEYRQMNEDYPYFVNNGTQYAVADFERQIRLVITACGVRCDTLNLTLLYNQFIDSVSQADVFEQLKLLLLAGETVSSEALEELSTDVFDVNENEITPNLFFESVKAKVDEFFTDVESSLIPSESSSSSLSSSSSSSSSSNSLTSVVDFETKFTNYMNEMEERLTQQIIVDERALNIDRLFTKSQMERPTWQNKYNGLGTMDKMIQAMTSLVALKNLKDFLKSHTSIKKYLSIILRSARVNNLSTDDVIIETNQMADLSTRAVTLQANQVEAYEYNLVRNDSFDHTVVQIMRDIQEIGFQCRELESDNPYINWQDLDMFTDPDTLSPVEVAEETPVSLTSVRRSVLDKSSLLPRVHVHWKYDESEFLKKQIAKIISTLNIEQQRFFDQQFRGGPRYNPGDIQNRLKMMCWRNGRDFFKDFMDQAERYTDTPNKERLQQQDFQNLTPIFSDIFTFVMVNDILFDKIEPYSKAVQRARALSFREYTVDIINNSDRRDEIYSEITSSYQYVIQHLQSFLDRNIDAAKALIDMQYYIGGIFINPVDLTGLIPNNLEVQSEYTFADVATRARVAREFQQFLDGERTEAEFVRLFLTSLSDFRKDRAMEQASSAVRAGLNYLRDEFRRFMEKSTEDFYLDDKIDDLLPVILPGGSNNSVRYTEYTYKISDTVMNEVTYEQRKVAFLASLRDSVRTNDESRRRRRIPLFLGKTNTRDVRKQKKFYMRNIARFGAKLVGFFKKTNNTDAQFCADILNIFNPRQPINVSQLDKKIRRLDKKILTSRSRTQRYLTDRKRKFWQRENLIQKKFNAWYKKEMQKMMDDGAYNKHMYFDFMAKVTVLATAGYYQNTSFDNILSILFRQLEDGTRLLGNETFLQYSMYNYADGERKTYWMKCVDKTKIETLYLRRVTSENGTLCFLNVPTNEQTSEKLYEQSLAVRTPYATSVISSRTKQFVDKKCVYRCTDTASCFIGSNLEGRLSKQLHTSGSSFTHSASDIHLRARLTRPNFLTPADRIDESGLECIGWEIGWNHSVNFVGDEWFVVLSNPFGFVRADTREPFEKFKDIPEHKDKILRLMVETYDMWLSMEQPEARLDNPEGKKRDNADFTVNPENRSDSINDKLEFFKENLFVSEKEDQPEMKDKWYLPKRNYVYSLNDFFAILRQYSEFALSGVSDDVDFLIKIAKSVFSKIPERARRKLVQKLKKDEPLGVEFVQFLSLFFEKETPFTDQYGKNTLFGNINRGGKTLYNRWSGKKVLKAGEKIEPLRFQLYVMLVFLVHEAVDIGNIRGGPLTRPRKTRQSTTKFSERKQGLLLALTYKFADRPWVVNQDNILNIRKGEHIGDSNEFYVALQLGFIVNVLNNDFLNSNVEIMTAMREIVRFFQELTMLKQVGYQSTLGDEVFSDPEEFRQQMRIRYPGRARRSRYQVANIPELKYVFEIDEEKKSDFRELSANLILIARRIRKELSNKYKRDLSYKYAKIDRKYGRSETIDQLTLRKKRASDMLKRQQDTSGVADLRRLTNILKNVVRRADSKINTTTDFKLQSSTFMGEHAFKKLYGWLKKTDGRARALDSELSRFTSGMLEMMDVPFKYRLPDSGNLDEPLEVSELYKYEFAVKQFKLSIEDDEPEMDRKSRSEKLQALCNKILKLIDDFMYLINNTHYFSNEEPSAQGETVYHKRKRSTGEIMQEDVPEEDRFIEGFQQDMCAELDSIYSDHDSSSSSDATAETKDQLKSTLLAANSSNVQNQIHTFLQELTNFSHCRKDTLLAKIVSYKRFFQTYKISIPRALFEHREEFVEEMIWITQEYWPTSEEDDYDPFDVDMSDAAAKGEESDEDADEIGYETPDDSPADSAPADSDPNYSPSQYESAFRSLVNDAIDNLRSESAAGIEKEYVLRRSKDISENTYLQMSEIPINERPVGYNIQNGPFYSVPAEKREEIITISLNKGGMLNPIEFPSSSSSSESSESESEDEDAGEKRQIARNAKVSIRELRRTNKGHYSRLLLEECNYLVTYIDSYQYGVEQMKRDVGLFLKIVEEIVMDTDSILAFAFRISQRIRWPRELENLPTDGMEKEFLGYTTLNSTATFLQRFRTATEHIAGGYHYRTSSQDSAWIRWYTKNKDANFDETIQQFVTFKEALEFIQEQLPSMDLTQPVPQALENRSSPILTPQKSDSELSEALSEEPFDAALSSSDRLSVRLAPDEVIRQILYELTTSLYITKTLQSVDNVSQGTIWFFQSGNRTPVRLDKLLSAPSNYPIETKNLSNEYETIAETIAVVFNIPNTVNDGYTTLSLLKDLVLLCLTKLVNKALDPHRFEFAYGIEKCAVCGKSFEDDIHVSDDTDLVFSKITSKMQSVRRKGITLYNILYQFLGREAEFSAFLESRQ